MLILQGDHACILSYGLLAVADFTFFQYFHWFMIHDSWFMIHDHVCEYIFMVYVYFSYIITSTRNSQLNVLRVVVLGGIKSLYKFMAFCYMICSLVKVQYFLIVIVVTLTCFKFEAIRFSFILPLTLQYHTQSIYYFISCITLWSIPVFKWQCAGPCSFGHLIVFYM